jgi:subtilisin family serine protease
MHRNSRPSRLSICLVLLQALVVAFALGAPGAARPGKQEPQAVPGELLVGFAATLPQAESHALVAGVSAKESRRFRRINAALLKVDPDKLEKTLEKLRRDPRVRYAEPNFLVHADALPNDPYYGQLWGLHTIGADAAWNASTGSNSVVTAVIDTGVDQSHPDLAANTWVNPGEDCPGCRTDGADNDGNGYVDDWRGWDFANNDNNPMDDHGHGTHVAGTIGAVGNNAAGVVGVNWRVRLMALKFLSAAGSGTTADAVSAVLYASANGASVLNNSWSGDEFSQALSDAIDAADQRNALFVAAAGNDGRDTDVVPAYPSSYGAPNVLSVTAADSADAPTFFGNYGRKSIDLAAPGVDILSTWTGSSYAYSSGTSMAAPHVSGVAALARSLYPAASDVGLKALILRTSHSAAPLAGLTASGARLDAAATTACAAEPKVWVDAPSTGFQVDTGEQVDVALLAGRCGDPQGLQVSATLNGTAVALTARGDGYYTGRFTASTGGRLELVAAATAGGASDTHTVVGSATQVIPIVAGGPPVTVTTTVPGENVQLAFAGRAGQRVSLQLRDVSLSPSLVTMSRPDGAALASTFVGSSGGFVDTRTLTADGSYRILVDPSGDDTGSMTLALFDVPADTSATVAPGGAAVTLATTVPGQNARATFEGRAGQRVSLRAANVTMTLANLSLVRVGGAAVGTGTIVGSAGAFVDARTLPENGTYAVVVDPQSANTGSATLTLYDVPPDSGGAIVPGGPGVSVTTTAPGQNARLSFDGTAGQRVSARVSNVTMPNAYVSLVKPDGSTLGSKTLVGSAGAFLDVRSLPSSGRYELLVDPLAAGTGSATVTLYDVPADVTATASPGGPPVSVNVATPGQNARVTFTGAAGAKVSVRVSNVTANANVSLFAPDGSYLARNILVGAAGGFLDTETLPAAGTYELLLDLQGAATGSATLTLYDVPPDAAFTGTVGGPSVAVSVTVPGQNARLSFGGTAGTRVSLVLSSVTLASSYVSVLRPDGTTQVSQTLVGPTGRTFTFDLTQTGTYVVVVDPRAAATGSMTLRLSQV